MLVEFAGLPGAGKTYLAARLAGELTASGVVASIGDREISAAVPLTQRLSRKITLTIATACIRPSELTNALSVVRASAQASGRDALAGYVQWVVTRGLAASAMCRSEVTVFEEGVVQTAWTLALRGNETALHAALHESADPRADVLVVVDVPPAIAAARLGARKSRHSRTQTLTFRERCEELTRGCALLDRLVESWAGDQSERVLRVVNAASRDADAAVRQIAARILSQHRL